MTPILISGSRLVASLVCVALTAVSPLVAQDSTASVPMSLVLARPRLESWRPSSSLVALPTAWSPQPVDGDGPRRRGRRAVVGGVIGAAAGLVFCTAMSTLADDSADRGISFCPLDSYLLIGGAGLGLGFAIGWLS